MSGNCYAHTVPSTYRGKVSIKGIMVTTGGPAAGPQPRCELWGPGARGGTITLDGVTYRPDDTLTDADRQRIYGNPPRDGPGPTIEVTGHVVIGGPSSSSPRSSSGRPVAKPASGGSCLIWGPTARGGTLIAGGKTYKQPINPSSDGQDGQTDNDDEDDLC